MATMVRSRKSRCTLPPAVRSSQPSATEAAIAAAAAAIWPSRRPTTPPASTFSQSAMKAFGIQDAAISPKDASSSQRSAPRAKRSDLNRAGSTPGRSAFPRIHGLRVGLLVRGLAVAEARRLQLEHRPVATPQSDQLLVRPQLHHAATFEDTDAVRMTHGGETMGDQ